MAKRLSFAFPFSFSRRRYGRTTYCWADVVLPNGETLDLGDPYPAINWPRSELLAEAERVIVAAMEG